MAAVKPSRAYASPRRKEAARSTRGAILDAARDLFVGRGYVTTSIDQIAERAGVSKPTVFTSVGNKRTLLKKLRDIALAGGEDATPVARRSWVQAVLAEPKPARSLELYARGQTELASRYADLEEVLHAAAGADDELRDLWQTNEHERLQAAAVFVDNLMSKGPLKPGLERAEAVDVMWTYMATDMYRRLVRDRGWGKRRYRQWLAGTLCAQLLP